MQDEENDLRCNSLRCRKLLINETKAVTTTCSHIFCIRCATDLFENSHNCPACHTSLHEPDDIILNSLSPTEDYKSSCLAGLSPSLIFDIAGRAIRFWQYQHSEESSFQSILLRDSQEKLAVIERKSEIQARESNNEIATLQMQINSISAELGSERRKLQNILKSHQEQENEIRRLKSKSDTKRQGIHYERLSRSAAQIPPSDRMHTPTIQGAHIPPTPNRVASANIYSTQHTSNNDRISSYNFDRLGPFEGVNKSPIKRFNMSSPLKTHPLSRRTYLQR